MSNQCTCDIPANVSNSVCGICQQPLRKLEGNGWDHYFNLNAESRKILASMADQILELRQLLYESDRVDSEGYWKPWDGNYEKKVYIVKDTTGEVYECWPNAGHLTVLSGKYASLQLKPNSSYRVWSHG